jgi:hypothetical protein
LFRCDFDSRPNNRNMSIDPEMRPKTIIVAPTKKLEKKPKKPKKLKLWKNLRLNIY